VRRRLPTRLCALIIGAGVIVGCAGLSPGQRKNVREVAAEDLAPLRRHVSGPRHLAAVDVLVAWHGALAVAADRTPDRRRRAAWRPAAGKLEAAARAYDVQLGLRGADGRLQTPGEGGAVQALGLAAASRDTPGVACRRRADAMIDRLLKEGREVLDQIAMDVGDGATERVRSVLVASRAAHAELYDRTRGKRFFYPRARRKLARIHQLRLMLARL
jgi:hypothetical protein